MISVIIAVYNPGKYLKECIESILGQQGVDFEMILIDDASTDGSDTVCRYYADTCPDIVRYHRLQENSGPSVARNKGIAMAKGEYIVFSDSDDCLMPGALAHLSDLIASTGASISIGGFFNGRIYRSSDVNNIDPEIETVSGREALEATLYQKPHFHASACAKIYRTEVLRHCLLLPGMHYEDLEWVSRLYPPQSRIAVSNRIVYFYRRNPDSFINSWSLSRLDALKATELILENVRALCPSCLDAARSRRFSACFNIFLEAAVRGEKDTAQYCFKEIKSLRRKIIGDPNVRLKNKIGAVLSYLGPGACTLIFRLSKR